MEIQFDEAKHEYFVDGKQVPGVTEILSPITASGYSKINPAVLEHAAMKGTLVHEWCEMYDYGCAEESMPTELVGYCKAYASFCEVYKPKWDGIEEMVYEPITRYAGRIDRFGILNGVEKAVVDIKTIQSPSTKNHISVCCQTAAYAIALDEESAHRYALYLKPDGTFRMMDCREYEDNNGFSGEELFFRLFDIYDAINRIGRRNK